MAVACMTVLCAWAHLQVVAPMPGLDSSFYADNWALISTSLTRLENAVRKLVAFLDDLKLRIAPDKSWTWSNKPNIRKKLRGLVIHSARVPVRHTAKDLGADVSYTRKRPYATKTKRIAKARTRLLKLGRTKIPGSFKKTVAVSAGLGCSAYGEEFVPHSKAPTHSLRVAVARALNRAGHGTNVWLALNAADTNLDPQWRAMLQRIRFWRRYVMAFPHRAQSVFARLALDPGTKPKGPVAFLAHVIRELGCTTSDDGLFIQYRQQKIAWVHAPPKLLQKFLWPHWNKYVAKQCAGRKHFDVTAFDAPLTSQVLESQAPRQRAIILACLAGKHYTSDILANYIAGCDGTCDLCGEPDGRLHRVFQCPATQAIRNEFADSVRAVAHWPEACRYFGGIPSWITFSRTSLPCQILPPSPLTSGYDLSKSGLLMVAVCARFLRMGLLSIRHALTRRLHPQQWFRFTPLNADCFLRLGKFYRVPSKTATVVKFMPSFLQSVCFKIVPSIVTARPLFSFSRKP